MSSLTVNSVANPYHKYVQNSASQNQSNFQALANALNSGNLSAAQSAFDALEQNYQTQSGQSSTTQSSQSSQNNTINADFQNLASALNSGNLTAAQQAYAQLQKDMQTQQSAGVHHHHRGGGNTGQAVQSLIASLASSSNSSSTSGNTLDLTA